MSDKLKFHRLTRPIRFRRVKVFFQSVGHTYFVGIERIKYLFNYVLYKLNILKRYTHEDFYVVHRPVINGMPISETHRAEVRTEHFVGVIVSELIDKVHLKQDYFYHEKGDHKKRTYTVIDMEKHLYAINSFVDKPGLVIDGKVYLYGDVPKIVRTFKYPKIEPGELPLYCRPAMGIPMPKSEVIEYDLTKLLNVQYETVLGDSIDLDVTYATVQAAIHEARVEIRKYLSSLSLKDIEV